jgi:hypothetical protein
MLRRADVGPAGGRAGHRRTDSVLPEFRQRRVSPSFQGENLNKATAQSYQVPRVPIGGGFLSNVSNLARPPHFGQGASFGLS